MYACICRGLTETDVRRAGRAGATTADDLITLFELDAPTCCGGCLRNIDRLTALAAEGAAGGHSQLVAARPSATGRLAGAARALVRSPRHATPATAG